ncbi:helix-turn-helix domain-containing protein [Mitsuaria sp. WAJ17]|nr:helix-turn-helix domain-containing protein [Mitsuaria sp. WAJ17]
MVAALDEAIALCGGAKAFVERIHVASSSPAMWRRRQSVPADHCPSIERETGGKVRCERLRPKVDWGYLRKSSPVQLAEGAQQG